MMGFAASSPAVDSWRGPVTGTEVQSSAAQDPDLLPWPLLRPCPQRKPRRSLPGGLVITGDQEE